MQKTTYISSIAIDTRFFFIWKDFFSNAQKIPVWVSDKKALANAGMVVGKVNSSLQSHFEKVGATMAKEWSQKAGSRGAAVLSAYK